jgi:hypothetical protein
VSAARKKSTAEMKAAKQKKIAIGGAVLLVGIMAFQGPKMLKLMSGGSSSAATAPAAVAPPVTPGVPAAPTPATPVSAPVVTPTKFVSFETFSTKDPFAQQVKGTNADVEDQVKPTAKPTTAAGTTTKTPTTTASPSSTPASGAGASTSTAKSSFKVATPSGGTGTAVLTVNGKRQTVAEESDFPKADPVFTLSIVGSGSVSVAIAGGSLKAGGKTFKLKLGKPLTLLNTSNGQKYTLELISTAPSGA